MLAIIFAQALRATGRGTRAWPFQPPFRCGAEDCRTGFSSPHPKGIYMNPSLRSIFLPFVSVVVAALAPVALAAFLTIPFNLGGHPGDARVADVSAGQHMT